MPKGTEGAIDARETLTISSRELPSAIVIPTKSKAPFSDASLATYLRRRILGKALFGGGKVVLSGHRNLLGELEGQDLRFAVFKGERRTASGPVFIAHNGNLPTLPQLSAQMALNGDKACVVMTPITSQHLAVFVVVSSDERAVVRRQGVFRVISAEAQVSSDVDHRRGLKGATAADAQGEMAKERAAMAAGATVPLGSSK